MVPPVDDQSQIQALDRTQPELPLKPGKAGYHDPRLPRNGVTTLFAALEGAVVGRCMQRHRHQEFLRFLGTIERAMLAAKVIHVAPQGATLARPPSALSLSLPRRPPALG